MAYRQFVPGLVKHSGHLETRRTKTNKTTNRNLQTLGLKNSMTAMRWWFRWWFSTGSGMPRLFLASNFRNYPEVALVSLRGGKLHVVGERVTDYAATRGEFRCLRESSRWVASLRSGLTLLRHNLCPAAMASKSARRRRKLPGKTSTFCSGPALIIRQRVARLTPKNFADADMPMSRGPWCTGICSGMPRSRIPSIASNCFREASSSFFNLSSVFIGSPPFLSTLRCHSNH